MCAARVAEFKALGYDELGRHVDFNLACEVVGRDGVKYAHETLTVYDDRKRSRRLRVMVEVWALEPDRLEWTKALATGGLLMESDGECHDWVDA